MTEKAERLQKLLAQAGIGSRREVEQWIRDGRLTVNGEIATLGVKASLKDRLLLDGTPLKLKNLINTDCRVIVYNKPEGVVCTRRDPEGRKTVFDSLPVLKHQRWISVGRLDLNTSGLLILTTDGELANRLMHPSHEVDREYAVRIHGQVDDSMIERLKQGVLLEDGMARFTDIHDSGGEGMNRWFHVVLMEGKNREVRRLWESQGVEVSRLKRVRYGCIFLPSRLRVGAWEELESKDINQLRDLVGLKPVRQKAKSRQQLLDKKRLQHKRPQSKPVRQTRADSASQKRRSPKGR